MASVKNSTTERRKNDGTKPLTIRITKDRKSTFIYLDYCIKEKDWDKKNQRVRRTHPNSARLNNYLLKKLSEVLDNSVAVESNSSNATVSTIRQKVKPTSKASVYAQANLYLERLKVDGKFNQYSADKTRVNRLKEYLKHDTSFSDISISILKRYKAWLLSTFKISERTAVNHLVIVRSLFSQAIAEGVCDPKFYPFGKGKIKIKFPDSNKIGLSKEDIEVLEMSELEDKAHHARNLFLFSFYFAGMRISDVLRMTWSEIQNNRLHYTMGKNQKGGSLKIPDKALAIIKQYKHDKDDTDLIFPELRNTDLDNKFLTQRDIATKNNRIDKLLRTVVAPRVGIEKKLTMHIARHTFGNLSGDKIPIQMLQKLYRHSSITTTINYQQNFIHKDADDALERVVNL